MTMKHIKESEQPKAVSTVISSHWYGHSKQSFMFLFAFLWKHWFVQLSDSCFNRINLTTKLHIRLRHTFYWTSLRRCQYSPSGSEPFSSGNSFRFALSLTHCTARSCWSTLVLAGCCSPCSGSVHSAYSVFLLMQNLPAPKGFCRAGWSGPLSYHPPFQSTFPVSWKPSSLDMPSAWLPAHSYFRSFCESLHGFSGFIWRMLQLPPLPASSLLPPPACSISTTWRLQYPWIAA
mgnify:CR=1 FL=1